MKASDRTILIALIVLGLFAAFWFLALAPKREEASELGDEITQLNEEVSSQQQAAEVARQAQDGYESNFSSLVVLGKAAPADGDTPSLLRQLVDISARSKATFGSLALGTAVEEVPAPAAETTTDQNSEAEAGEEAAPATTTAAAPATEAAAATLPIGASVGSAGLGRLAYDMIFQGDFFQIADLFKGIDNLVASENASVDVSGRLITINKFTMTKEEPDTPLEVELSISSYVLPSSQGLTAGATSTMPPSTVPAAAPVSEPAP